MQKLLLDIYNSKEIAAITAKCKNGEDCKQDVFTELFAKDEKFFESIKDLKAYIAICIFNKSKKQIDCVSIDESHLNAVNFEFRQKIDTKALTWYENEILELYLDLGSYGKISKLTSIPKSSIKNTIHKIRAKFKI